ncbi:MAG TPA: hypothetical protein VL728_19395 [Cyclobacteriaceae bacterium]|nr:hypothetical protein [Cyclobacteriaceae bacterium]
MKNHSIDRETPEKAAITCRVLTKNDLQFEEEEFMPISGIRIARFNVDENTLKHYFDLINKFVPDNNDHIQINGDKESRFNWVGTRH